MDIYPDSGKGMLDIMNQYSTASYGQPAAPNPGANASVSVGASGVQGQAAGLLVVLAGLVLIYIFTRDIQNGRK